MKSKKVGGNTSTILYSPGRIRAMERSKSRTEKKWASLAGPVITSRIGGDDNGRLEKVAEDSSND
jgi:hypothetical protein